MSSVKRLEKILKSLYVEVGKDNRFKEIKGFIFHDGSKEVFKIEKSYIDYEHEVETSNGKKFKKTSSLESFELSQVRNARKIDYSKKDNFYCSSDNCLYIYTGVNEGDVQVKGVKKNVESILCNTIYYHDVYSLLFNCGEFTVNAEVKVFRKSKPTEEGVKIKKVSEALRTKYGINITNHSIEKLLKDNVIDINALL